jgi:hypothetical protein
MRVEARRVITASRGRIVKDLVAGLPGISLVFAEVSDEGSRVDD